MGRITIRRIGFFGRPTSAARTRRADALAFAALGVCAALEAVIAYRRVDPARPAWFVASFASVAVAVAVTGIAAYARAARSLRRLAISPFVWAAATWLVLFVVRPLELYFAPSHASIALAELGFRLADLTRANAIAGLGCVTWGAGYLLTLGPPIASSPPDPRKELSLSVRGAVAALTFGTLLWGALFMRQGGPGALIHSAASIRVNESSSFYGFVGVWMVQGVTLYALAVLLTARTRASRRLFAIGAVVSVAAGVALQLRSLTAFTAIAAVAMYLAVRKPGRRILAAGAALAVAAALLLGLAQQVRAFTSTYSTSQALELGVKTPPWAWYVSDLSTYDNLVAMQGLVPGSIPYLDGRTLEEIPAALVPRTLWPGKPLGIDFRVSSYLYPGVAVAVPISVQGELYWNGGIAAVAVGAFLLGLALGAVARCGLRIALGGAFVLYAVTLAFTHGLLTRGLATTIENLVLALVGVGIAVAATSGARPRALVGSAKGRARRWSRHPFAPSSARTAFGEPGATARER